MAKGKLSRTKKIASAADVRVKVDGKLKSLWDRHLRALEQAKGQGAKAFDLLWEVVDVIVNHDPPLWVVGDYASASEFFAKELHETERTAQRNIRVARYATAAEEERYGVSTLDAAIGFLEAKHGGPLPGRAPIAFERVTIPVKQGGVTHARRLADVSVKQIQAATAALTGGAKKHPASDAYRAITKALAAQKPLANVEVHERNGLFAFHGVPSGALHHFGAAVTRASGAGKK